MLMTGVHVSICCMTQLVELHFKAIIPLAAVHALQLATDLDFNRKTNAGRRCSLLWQLHQSYEATECLSHATHCIINVTLPLFIEQQSKGSHVA